MSLRVYVCFAAAVAASCAAAPAPRPDEVRVPAAPAPQDPPTRVSPRVASAAAPATRGGGCRAQLPACAHPREAQAPRHFGGVRPTPREDVPETRCVCDECGASSDCTPPETCDAVVTDACRPELAPRRCLRPDTPRSAPRECEESRIPGKPR